MSEEAQERGMYARARMGACLGHGCQSCGIDWKCDGTLDVQTHSTSMLCDDCAEAHSGPVFNPLPIGEKQDERHDGPANETSGGGQ